MELYKGGLGSSLDLIYAQVATLTARVDQVRIKARLLRSTVDLIRSLGGGWDRGKLPDDEEIQPFTPLQYDIQAKPQPVGDVDTAQSPADTNLTKTVN